MTAIRSLARVSLAAGLLLSASLPSHAFSQIGRQDGSAPDQDGVISTPLPPLSLPPIPPAGEAQNETRPAEAAPDNSKPDARIDDVIESLSQALGAAIQQPAEGGRSDDAAGSFERWQVKPRRTQP